jgi:membrane-bound lytic murein transglycosylase B
MSSIIDVTPKHGGPPRSIGEPFANRLRYGESDFRLTLDRQQYVGNLGLGTGPRKLMRKRALHPGRVRDPGWEQFMKRTMVSALVMVAALMGLGDQAQSVDRPALPANVAWVVDETDPSVLALAFSAPRGERAALDHQRALHAIVLNPELREPTLKAIASATRRAVVVGELEAALQLRALTKPQPNLPKWNLIAPASASELRAAYDKAQKETGIEWQYLAAVNFVETKMGRIRGTSTAGAQGPMQFLPSTWKIYGKGGDINSVTDSIAAAARFLKAKGGPANMSKALFRYNNSNKYVVAITTYAQNMKADPGLFTEYHAWSVIYRWAPGDVYLQEGYSGP